MIENHIIIIKFVFSKKATKFYKIFTGDLTLAFVKFCGLLRKYELYQSQTDAVASLGVACRQGPGSWHNSKDLLLHIRDKYKDISQPLAM